jgi:WWE domain
MEFLDDDYSDLGEMMKKSGVLQKTTEVVREEPTIWLYESFEAGWWKFNDHTNKLLQDTFERGGDLLSVIISGKPYLIDLKKMTQRDILNGTERKLHHVTQSGLDAILIRKKK